MENIFFGEPLASVSAIEHLPTENSKCAIVSTRWDLAEELHNKGYVFVDRTIKATIPLKDTTNFQKLCRLEIEESTSNERIHEIAEKSFVNDARFFSTFPPKFDEKLFDDYFSEMESCYICRVKNEIAGFMEIVVDSSNKSGEGAVVRLAAVDERYRLSGAAVSLYAGAADLWRQKNFRRLEGRVSCRNMPVVNLYASFGATFSCPLDIYIRS